MNDTQLYFFGFSFWKQKQTQKFFTSTNTQKIYFCKTFNEAIKHKINKDSKVYIWGKKDFQDVEIFCKKENITLNRVEDGFVRSVSLGSDLTKAYSLVVDSRGIYFDPTTKSDLEHILQTYLFDDNMLDRAKELRKYLVEKKLSKYNTHKNKTISFKTHKKIVLVVGQVEDDASIIYGGDNMRNLELLKKVKQTSDGFIVYKPHPDVLAGNRKGHIEDKDIYLYADEQILDISLPSLLEACDELHTITSLSGFEALLREKKVYTYGMPFYAGWGLTVDEKICKRRDRKVSIDELVAATYILYPRYLNPKTNTSCEAEVLIEELEKLKNRYNDDKIYRFFTNIRNFISRKIQLLIKICLNK